MPLNEKHRINHAIVHTNNNHAKINTLEELHIIRAATLANMLNDIISSKNGSLYKLLSPTDRILTVNSQNIRGKNIFQEL